MQYKQEVIAMRILTVRKKLNLSQEKLAEKLNVNRNTIISWETISKKAKIKGRIPPLDDMLQMCNLFECDLTYLLGEHDTKRRATADVREVTGLSEKAIENLINLNNIRIDRKKNIKLIQEMSEEIHEKQQTDNEAETFVVDINKLNNNYSEFIRDLEKINNGKTANNENKFTQTENELLRIRLNHKHNYHCIDVLESLLLGLKSCNLYTDNDTHTLDFVSLLLENIEILQPLIMAFCFENKNENLYNLKNSVYEVSPFELYFNEFKNKILELKLKEKGNNNEKD